MSEPLLQVQDLEVHFPTLHGVVKAVDGVSFTLKAGETLGLVGESGCGKSTAARGISRLVDPTGGRVLFEGRDLAHATDNELRELRQDMQMIFQDPYASLDPRMTVLDIIAEPIRNFRIARGKAVRTLVRELLERVGLDPDFEVRYPHEFSGGQRQRIGVARALAVNPVLILCDEPVSALDVSIQAQVVNLLEDLQNDLGLAYLFISHDLSVVRHVSDRIAVMYLGRIVETGTTAEIFEDPQHPYTQALLSAVPHADPSRRTERVVLRGDVPSPIHPPSGCHFRPRCPVAEERCRVDYPGPVPLGGEHSAACHLVQAVQPQTV